MGMVDFKLSDIGDTIRAVREAITGEKIQDPAEMQRLANDLATMEAALRQGQMKVNEAEAAHPSIFVAGWRPWIGWVAGMALAWQYIAHPMLVWLLAIFAPDLTPPPALDLSGLYPLILGMLGIGAMRSYDKKSGVDTRAVRRG